VEPFARPDVKDFHGLVILGHKKHAITLEVSGKMFEIPYVAGQKSCVKKSKGRIRLSCGT
jgi:hypothetical protein